MILHNRSDDCRWDGLHRLLSLLMVHVGVHIVDYPDYGLLRGILLGVQADKER